MNTKCLRVTILVEVRLITAVELIAIGVVDRETSLIPETRVFAGVIVLIPKCEVVILPVALV